MKKRTFLVLAAIMTLAALCSCSLFQGQQGIKGSSAAETYVAQNIASTMAERTHVAGTQVALFTTTPVPTEIPTITLTPSPSPYPTKETVWLDINKDSNCRLGPSNAYKLVLLLKAGVKVQVVGRDNFNDYFYVRNPDESGSACWVWAKYTTVTGDTARVPVYTAIPSPTPTFTATTPPGVSVSYDSLSSCGSEYFLKLFVRNEGSLKWESISLVITDKTTSTTFVHELDSFQSYNGCTVQSNQKDLSAWEDGYVTNYNPGQFGYDPTGHNLSVSVTVFSEDGRKGLSASTSISVTP